MDESQTRKAANGSWACAIVIGVLIKFCRRTGEPQPILAGICLLLMAVGLLLGIKAMYGIFKHGGSGFIRAVLGIANNGAFLYFFASGFLAASAAHANARKDGSSDVRQSAAAPQVAATPVPTPTGPPQLRKIMWISTRPSAQLDKDWAFEGDHVRGYKVTKISHDSVDLLTPEGAPLKLALAAQVAGK